MPNHKKALVLVNTGTPDQPTTGAVRKYLFQFLNDRRIIDIPPVFRLLLVNLIIVPFRAPRSAKKYRQLWTEEGSPLLLHLRSLTSKVQQKLKDTHDVFGVMRYGNPSFRKLFRKLVQKNYDEIIVLPLYPQYATSTTESVADIVNNNLPDSENTHNIRFIRQFYRHPAFVDAWTHRIRSYNPQQFDHIVFSYHGLPIRQIEKMHPGIKSETCPCTTELPAHGEYCYKATCYHTSRLLAKKLGISNQQHTTSFQSRLSKNWMKPFTDQVLKALAESGKKRVLIAAPSFVADCLETTVELGKEYNALFKKHGGQDLTLVKSLNEQDEWAEAIAEIAIQ